MKNLTFNFEESAVRVVVRADGPWFVVRDVAGILGIANYRAAVADFPEDEKGVVTTDTLGGPQQLTAISEPGLYRLIFQSRKAEAEAFKRWVLHDVLPALRKRGRYEMPRLVAEEGGCRMLSLPEFLKEHGLQLALSIQMRVGLRAWRYARALGAAVSRVPDDGYGRLRTYPEAILGAVLYEEARTQGPGIFTLIEAPAVVADGPAGVDTAEPVKAEAEAESIS